MAFTNLAENAERLTKRIQETIQEQTREFTKPIGSYLDAPDLDKPGNIQKLLDSSSDREKLEGMKRLIAMISKNRNVSQYFAQVVKNVVSHNLEIRKLVYIYILRYAQSEPDLALLSINTFQKDLSDSNPLIRAMALRVLSGIPVPMIGNVVVLGIKKCAADPSPYVRKAAALSIIKCYALDSAHLSTLTQILTTLLRDRSPLSLGSVALAFNAICPHRFELLHQHYRRLCKTLVDVDEWGQVHLLDLLGRYARSMLSEPPESLSIHEGAELQLQDESESESPKPKLDVDLELLLKSALPLLQSRNPAVVMAVVRTFYYLGPSADRHKIIIPLLRLLHSPKEMEQVVLEDIAIVAMESPNLLTPHATKFYIRSADSSQVKKIKLRILSYLINEENAHTMLRELKDYVVDTDDELVSDAIWAIGRCAELVPETTTAALAALTMLIRSSNDVAVAAAVDALRSLHQLHPTTQSTLTSDARKPVNIVGHLASRFNEIRHPNARACVIWMVGQYAAVSEDSEEGRLSAKHGIRGITPWSPDILRLAARSFKGEASIVKLQTITLAAKLVVLASEVEALSILARYVFALARYDMDYDVRDRGRLLSALLIGVASGLTTAGADEVEERKEGVVLRREQVRKVLFEGKGVPEHGKKLESAYKTIGSTSLVIQHEMIGYHFRKLPDWPEEGTDSSLRDTEDDRPSTPFYSHPSSGRMFGIGSQSLGASGVPTPIVLTPGGSSPAGSFPKPGTSAISQKAQFMSLEDFYKTSSEEEGDEEDEEEGEDEEEEEEGGGGEGSQPPPIPGRGSDLRVANTSETATTTINTPSGSRQAQIQQASDQESLESGEEYETDEEEESEDEGEDEEFLKRV